MPDVTTSYGKLSGLISSLTFSPELTKKENSFSQNNNKLSSFFHITPLSNKKYF